MKMTKTLFSDFKNFQKKIQKNFTIFSIQVLVGRAFTVISRYSLGFSANVTISPYKGCTYHDVMVVLFAEP